MKRQPQQLLRLQRIEQADFRETQHVGEGGRRLEGMAMGARRTERGVDVAGHRQPGRFAEMVGELAARIAAAVEAFVMVLGDLDGPAAAGPEPAHDAAAVAGMFVHDPQGVVVERAVEEQDLRGNVEHADVVDQGRHDRLGESAPLRNLGPQDPGLHLSHRQSLARGEQSRVGRRTRTEPERLAVADVVDDLPGDRQERIQRRHAPVVEIAEQVGQRVELTAFVIVPSQAAPDHADAIVDADQTKMQPFAKPELGGGLGRQVKQRAQDDVENAGRFTIGGMENALLVADVGLLGERLQLGEEVAGLVEELRGPAGETQVGRQLDAVRRRDRLLGGAVFAIEPAAESGDPLQQAAGRARFRRRGLHIDENP